MNLPEEFLERAHQFTGNEFDLFIKSLSGAAPVGVRMNPFKSTDTFSKAEKIPWSSEGKYLDQRPSFTLDPLFHAGCYYVQEASSQFLEQVFLQAKKSFNGPLRILDLCAAPGGKSTHLLSLMKDDDLLVCNELIPARNNILRQNINKWGRSNVIVTQNDPADFNRVENYFDIILVDAPCSGEGLFRKDPEAVEEWSVDNVRRCSLRQNEILNHAHAALKPGGVLIYSTCTYEESENDEQVQYLIDKFGMMTISVESIFQGIVKTKKGLSFMPHRVKGEGFYISMLRKDGSDKYNSTKVIEKSEPKYLKRMESYIENGNDFNPVYYDDRLYAIPKKNFADYNFLVKKLYVRLAGINIGEFKGDDLIPSAALALSDQIKKDFQSAEVNNEQALQYLKGSDIKIEISKGWNLIRYNNFNLGWVKNLGSRMNNYYPKEWRIKISIK